RSTKRRAVGKRILKQYSQGPAPAHHVLRRERRVDLLQALVVGGAQEGERRGQRTRADARYELEAGARAGRCPSDEEPGGIGASFATARDRKEFGRPQVADGV